MAPLEEAGAPAPLVEEDMDLDKGSNNIGNRGRPGTPVRATTLTRVQHDQPHIDQDIPAILGRGGEPHPVPLVRRKVGLNGTHGSAVEPHMVPLVCRQFGLDSSHNGAVEPHPVPLVYHQVGLNGAHNGDVEPQRKSPE